MAREESSSSTLRKMQSDSNSLHSGRCDWIYLLHWLHCDCSRLHQSPQLIMFDLSDRNFEKVSFAFKLAFTILSDQLNYIHAVSLRWALYREGRLNSNTNIRLIASSRNTPPNRWWTNLFSICCLILCYSALSQLYMEAISSPIDYKLYSINSGALLYRSRLIRRNCGQRMLPPFQPGAQIP
jgi:hypothetical protein